MATAAYQVVHDSANLKLIKWNLKHTTAPPFDERIGQPYVFPGRFPDKSVQMYGTFGAGVIKLQGSNEVVAAPTNWLSLNDPLGAELTFATATKRVAGVLENTYQVRPNFTTLAADVDVVVYLLIKG